MFGFRLFNRLQAAFYMFSIQSFVVCEKIEFGVINPFVSSIFCIQQVLCWVSAFGNVNFEFLLRRAFCFEIYRVRFRNDVIVVLLWPFSSILLVDCFFVNCESLIVYFSLAIGSLTALCAAII